jgi:D-lactate dehydrogenase
MKIAVFESRRYERAVFDALKSQHSHSLTYLDVRATPQTIRLAEGHDCLCSFVSDQIDAEVLTRFHAMGGRLIAQRAAGYNNIDLATAAKLGLKVVRVPEYSPYAVAEHAVALLQTLNRKTHRAYNRVREGNFSLEGLTGFDLYGKTVGLIGTGRIGAVLAKIMHGFGCQLQAYDLKPNTELEQRYGVRFLPLAEVLATSDILSLHVPLTAETRHILDAAAMAAMKRGVVLINTGRGGLIDAEALIDALKTGQVGAAGLDVYEGEEGLFFEDHSSDVLQDDTLARLISFPNVVITSHQAFLTREALQNIASTTLQNITDFEQGRPLVNEVTFVKATA